MRNLKTYFKKELKEIYSENELNVLFEMLMEFINNQYVKNNINELILTSEQQLVFDEAIVELKKNVPIQYVLGIADFYGFKFKVNQNVLIPRPETEELVYLIIKEQGNKAIDILDIGTGSGCIPISLKLKLPLANVDAIDISEEALVLARQNAIENRAEVHFFKDDALNLPAQNYKKYDVVVSNPPYIALSEKINMDAQVLDYEPHLALFVEDHSTLIFYDKIADFAFTQLKKEGVLYFEINQAFGKETKQLLENKGFKAQIIKDINDNERIIKAQLLG